MHFIKSVVWICALTVLIGWSTQTLGARVGNLFSAEVPVTERSSDEKTRAAAQALAEVLVKVSGDQRIAQNPLAAELLAKAEDFIQQYRYTPNNTLLVGFDGRNLEQEMRRIGLAVWSSNRPSTLIWLAVDNGQGEREILSADDQGEVRTQIESIAAQRGLVLLWPLNDSVDRAIVTAADIWGGYSDKVKEASRRYAADALLVARVGLGDSGEHYGSWQLELTEEDQHEWRGGLISSTNKIADIFARRLASSAGVTEASLLSMQVSGVDSGRAYAHTISALEKIGSVERVQVVQAVGDTLYLELNMRGHKDSLTRALSFSRVLVPDLSSSPTGSAVRYRYAQ